ncbi:ABC transporter ATP-binding protein [Pelistega sp. NLN82]|uniref:ABC transporter ATP-binding protein n=1 Tax=Pelistega ratti TaxID=2652177 RepID=A0A6L9Y8S3_9BURK|nr:ABC transporter ATP-binding protein [Pelistega ratti]NEN76238.1 ABC transporter ATP-binding protein [Pelistega ratti]
MSKEAYIVLKNISKTFKQMQALKEVDLSLYAGECVGLVGHNGAGKSTLIKLILGLIQPTEGSIQLFNQDFSLKNASELRRQIGYLPETVALHGALTGEETLNFYARLKGVPLEDNLSLLARVGIAQAANRRVGTYSKGMRQRLALAQALLGEPKVLLFDEPTTGLDPASRQMFYDIVGELKAKGTTILLSTHALAELEGYADRIVVMKNGVKLADGTLKTLQSQSGLPERIEVKFKSATNLPSHWEKIGENAYSTQSLGDQKITLLKELGDLDLLASLDIYTPSLDEMYMHMLKREDI